MKLILPERSYLGQYEESRKEYIKHNVDTYSFQDSSEYDIFNKFEKDRLGKELPPNIVPQITYWLIDKGEFIGEVGIRTRLNENLLKRGGNIGYGIRLSKWNKGYGNKILKLALKEAKKIGLEKVLLTCNADNYMSEKVIIKNGGIFDNVVENRKGDKIILSKRFWIII